MCESSRPNKCESSTSRESEIKRGRHHHNNDSIVAFTDSSILFRFEFFGLSVRACVRACASLLGLNNNIVYLNTLSALHTIFSNIYNGCLFIIRTHLRAHISVSLTQRTAFHHFFSTLQVHPFVFIFLLFSLHFEHKTF